MYRDFDYQCSCRLVKGIIFLRLSETHKLYYIKRLLTNEIESFLNSALLKYSWNFANLSLNILIKYIVIEKKRDKGKVHIN